MPEVNNRKMSIRILIKNKGFYEFCKEDTKRAYFIFEILFFIKKRSLII
ncbi:plasmid partition family protein [Borreliella burgdorferi]|nr:plasmid partition family protein [Borreliella burgdorferi]